MIEDVEYLEENFGVDLQKSSNEDYLLSMILYEEDDSKDVPFYDLISAYLTLCEEVKEDYKELFESITSDALVSKARVLMKSITLDNITEIDDNKYTFEISAKYPVPFSIKLRIEDISNNNNNNDDSNYLLKDYNDSDYELMIDLNSKCDTRAIVIAEIFNSCVDREYLYDLVRRMYLVNHIVGYTAHTDKSLPIGIEFSEAGNVELFYTGANNRQSIMLLDKNQGVFVQNPFGITPAYNDFLCNFYYGDANIIDPIWVLKNIFVSKDDITSGDLLDVLEEDTKVLDDLFEKSGYQNSISYRDMYYDDHTLYYVYGTNNELLEIEDYESVGIKDECYIFTFEDGSSVSYPKDKIVVVIEDDDVERVHESDAIRSLNLRL